MPLSFEFAMFGLVGKVSELRHGLHDLGLMVQLMARQRCPLFVSGHKQQGA